MFDFTTFLAKNELHFEMSWKSTSDFTGLVNTFNIKCSTMVFDMASDALIESGSPISLWEFGLIMCSNCQNNVEVLRSRKEVINYTEYGNAVERIGYAEDVRGDGHCTMDSYNRDYIRNRVAIISHGDGQGRYVGGYLDSNGHGKYGYSLWCPSHIVHVPNSCGFGLYNYTFDDMPRNSYVDPNDAKLVCRP